MPAALVSEKIYVFEEFRLEPQKRVLIRKNKEQIRLAHRPFQVLLYLIENRGRLVKRDELLEKFWDGRDVYDTALTKAVGAIRHSLDETTENPRFIETRWAEGYRFIGKIEEQPAFEPSFVEIEKTREVKFVIEERDESGAGQSEPPAPAGAFPVAARQSKLQTENLKPQNPQTKSRSLSQAALIILVLTLLVGASAFLVFQFTRPRPEQAQANQPAPIRSIAVLPFKNLSSNPNGEIFTEGMTENLIGSLSKIENLKVISRNSVSVFKDKDADPREIAERLGVETFIEGSVRASGGRIRVEARLVNAQTGEILWSGGADERPVGDVLEIQDDIARSVAARLRLKLTETEEQRLAKRQTNNPEAYQAFVKGRYFWKKKDRENLEKARKFFEEAITKDPNYALAYAGVADYYLTGIWYADFPPEQSLKKAKELFLKVSEIDDRLPEAHSLRARIAAAEWDWETCRKEFEKALELNPNEADYWQGYAFFLRNVDGRFDEAAAVMRRAQELDPLSVSVNTDVGVMLNHAGRLDEAIEAFKKTLETDPQFFDAYWNLGLAYERKKMFDEATAAFIESERLKGMSKQRLDALRAAYGQGMKVFWQKWLEFWLTDAKEKNVPAFVIAAFYARAGEKDAALEWLEKSYAAREPLLVNLKSEFAFDSLRPDARFTDLLLRVGLNK
jgi:TolB-like protein/DNA-binding winged helix-turn-helix (wHTH) protein/Tfp pilus assembly protein PilF